MKVAIYGSGGFGREVRQVIDEISAATTRSPLSPDPITILGFLDDDQSKVGTTVADLPVLGGVDWVRNNPTVGVVLGVGSPSVKRSIVERLRPFGTAFPTIAHPSILVGRAVTFGEGCIFCSGNVFTTDVKVGSFVTFNIGCAITHDDIVGDFVTFAPACNLSGNVHVGEGSDIGTRMTAIPGVRIGSWCVVGAGAVVTRDLPDFVTAVGIPAKVIKQREHA